MSEVACDVSVSEHYGKNILQFENILYEMDRILYEVRLKAETKKLEIVSSISNLEYQLRKFKSQKNEGTTVQ
jgi:hypothetical protein